MKILINLFQKHWLLFAVLLLILYIVYWTQTSVQTAVSNLGSAGKALIIFLVVLPLFAVLLVELPLEASVILGVVGFSLLNNLLNNLGTFIGGDLIGSLGNGLTSLAPSVDWVQVVINDLNQPPAS